MFDHIFPLISINNDKINKLYSWRKMSFKVDEHIYPFCCPQRLYQIDVEDRPVKDACICSYYAERNTMLMFSQVV